MLVSAGNLRLTKTCVERRENGSGKGGKRRQGAGAGQEAGVGGRSRLIGHFPFSVFRLYEVAWFLEMACGRVKWKMENAKWKMTSGKNDQ